MARWLLLFQSALHPDCKRWIEVSSRHSIAELCEVLLEAFDLPRDRHWSLFTETPWSEEGWYGPEVPNDVTGWPGRALEALSLEVDSRFYLLQDLAAERWFEGVVVAESGGTGPASPRCVSRSGELPPAPAEGGEETLPDAEDLALRRRLADRFAQAPDPAWDPAELEECRELAWEMLEAADGVAGRLAGLALRAERVFAPWVVFIASALMREGREEEGIELGEEYAELLDSVEIYTGLAALFMQHDPEEALRRAEDCLERFPGSALARMTVARILLTLGRSVDRMRRLAAETVASAGPRQLSEREMGAELFDELDGPPETATEPSPSGPPAPGDLEGPEHQAMAELFAKALAWILRPERAAEVAHAWSLWSGEPEPPETIRDPELFVEDDFEGSREAFYAWLAFEWRHEPEAPSFLERWRAAAGGELDPQEEQVVERLARSRLRLYATRRGRRREEGTPCRFRDLLGEDQLVVVPREDFLEVSPPVDLVLARIVELDGRLEVAPGFVRLDPDLKPAILGRLETVLETMLVEVEEGLSFEGLADRILAPVVLGVWRELGEEEEEDAPWASLGAGLFEDVVGEGDFLVDGEMIVDARARAHLASPEEGWLALSEHPRVNEDDSGDLYWYPREEIEGVDLEHDSLAAVFQLDGPHLLIQSVSRARLAAAEAFVQEVLDCELSFEERVDSIVADLAARLATGEAAELLSAAGLEGLDKLDLADEPVIDELFEEFLEEQEERLAERTFADYEEIVSLLRHCLDVYGHNVLLPEERELLETAEERGMGFCEVLGAEQLLRAYPEFLGYFLVRKVGLTRSLARNAGTVTKKLARWLAARDLVSSEVEREALERAAAARHDLPAAVELSELLDETTMGGSDVRLDEETEILEDHFTITRVLDDRIWLEGLLEGGDLGPVRLPRAAAERCRIGWTISGTLAETEEGWSFIETWNVYPD